MVIKKLNWNPWIKLDTKRPQEMVVKKKRSNTSRFAKELSLNECGFGSACIAIAWTEKIYICVCNLNALAH